MLQKIPALFLVGRLKPFSSLTLLLTVLLCLSGCGFRQGETAAPIPATSTLIAFTPTATKPTQIADSILSVTKAVSTPTVVSFSMEGMKKELRPVADPQNWHYQWIKGIPCRAPCWQGITPGQTTLSEAVEMLKKMPQITQLTTGSFLNDKPPRAYAYWTWSDIKHFRNPGGGGSGDSGDVTALAEKPQIIYSISDSSPISFKLGDVFAAYGEPEYIIATMERQPHYGVGDIPPFYFYVTLIYLSKGFEIKFWDNYKPKLSLETLFENPGFFVPGTRYVAGSNDSYSAQTLKLMLPWQGFKPFETYCRLVSDIDCTERLKNL